MSVPLEDELQLSAFFVAVWLMEKIFLHGLGVSPLLGQTVAGILVGPALLDAVPFTGALRLLGKLGVFLLVIESGLSLDAIQVRQTGARAFWAALTGVVCPVVLTYVILVYGFGEQWTAGLAAGAAIAPTSMGFSAQLLKSYGLLSTNEGQLVVSAAAIDDVLSLVLLAEVQNLSTDDNSSVSAWEAVRPILGSVCAIIAGSLLTGFLLHRVATASESLDIWLSPRQSAQKRHATTDSVLIFLLLFWAALLAWACRWLLSSELLGVFFAGLTFSQNERTKAAWQCQFKRHVRWGAALFFAATIGFGIPSVSDLLDTRSLYIGALLLAASLTGKMSLGLFAIPVGAGPKASVPAGSVDVPEEEKKQEDCKATVDGENVEQCDNLNSRRKDCCLLEWSSCMRFGWAMQGRGEFSFLIRDEAQEDGILSKDVAAGVAWALLITCLVAPIGFRYVLSNSSVNDGFPTLSAVREDQADNQPSIEMLERTN